MRVYEISTGWMYDETPHGLRRLACGHSGFEEAMDDATKVGVPHVGPLPPGAYDIGDPYDHPHLGPCTMNLTPLGKTDTMNRGDFRIHGMSALGARESSHGCLLFGPRDRETISRGSRLLLVVSALTRAAPADVMV